MLSLGKRTLYLLLALVLVTASLPLHATCDTTEQPEASPCATGCGALDPAAGTDCSDEASPCGLDCTDCGLLCCVGTAMILTAAPVQAAVAPIQASLPPHSLVRPQMDPSPLGHPPRV